MNIEDIILKKDKPEEINIAFNNAWNIVEKYCSDSLYDIKETHKLLYRSVSTSNNLKIFLGQNREKRKTIERYSFKYAILIDLILKHYNFEALRLNSIFCNSDLSQVRGFYGGSTYIIFPVTGFKFTWNEDFSSANAMIYFLNIMDINSMQDIKAHNITEKYIKDDKLSDQDFKYLAHAVMASTRFDNTDFKKALESGNDIWFKGKYIAFDYNIFSGLIEDKINDNQ